MSSVRDWYNKMGERTKSPRRGSGRKKVVLRLLSLDLVGVQLL